MVPLDPAARLPQTAPCVISTIRLTWKRSTLLPSQPGPAFHPIKLAGPIMKVQACRASNLALASGLAINIYIHRSQSACVRPPLPSLPPPPWAIATRTRGTIAKHRAHPSLAHPQRTLTELREGRYQV